MASAARNKPNQLSLSLFSSSLPRKHGSLAGHVSSGIFCGGAGAAFAIEVEANCTFGSPVVVVVGLPDAAVKESRDRVKTAIDNSGFRHPYGRTTINLAPADVKKEGPSFDLPIALGILAASEQLTAPRLEDYWVVGELALNGDVRPVRGALSIALAARKHKKKGCSFPSSAR